MRSPARPRGRWCGQKRNGRVPPRGADRCARRGKPRRTEKNRPAAGPGTEKLCRSTGGRSAPRGRTFGPEQAVSTSGPAMRFEDRPAGSAGACGVSPCTATRRPALRPRAAKLRGFWPRSSVPVSLSGPALFPSAQGAGENGPFLMEERLAGASGRALGRLPAAGHDKSVVGRGVVSLIGGLILR